MNPRSLLLFLKTRTGRFLCFVVLLLIAFFLVRGMQERKNLIASPDRKAVIEGSPKPQLVQTVIREMTPFHPPPVAATVSPVPPEPRPSEPRDKQEVLPISLYAAQQEETSSVFLGKDYAPFGRLVQCELIVTVDSSTIQTPIIGLVTDDVWHDGRLIIPAGTEVHSAAKVDRVRERIAGSRQWTFVWQGGEELSVSGIALDRERDADGGTWGITDGSAGLRGELLKSDDLAEIKLFTATFLSGAASGLTEKEQTIFGSQAKGSLQNAPIVGAQQVLNVYARQILDTIQRDGFYVRVPAGKQFYVYVTQTIDKSKATIGGTQVASNKRSSQSRQVPASDPLSRLNQNLQRLAPSSEEPLQFDFPVQTSESR